MNRKTAGLHILPVYMLFFLLMLLPLRLYPADIDNSYIEDKSSSFIVKPWAGFTFTAFSFDNDEDKKSVSYTSRPGFTVGLSMAWKFLGLSAGYRKPMTDDEYCNGENEKSFDLRLNYYGRYMGCDLYIQRQKGFFLEDGDDDSTNPLRYYGDIVLNNVSFGIYYIFSWDTYSMRAVFDGADIQKKTSSSFLLRAVGGIMEIKSDGSLLLDEGEPALDRTHGLDYCSQKYISMSPGYGWTLVFGGNYYLNMAMFLGMGVQETTYRSDSGENRNWRIIPDTDFRMAAGYSSERIFYGFSVIAAMHISHLDCNIDTSCILVNAVFHAGYRFF